MHHGRCMLTKLPVRQISSSEIAGLLMMLELDGWVRDDGSLEYSLARHPD